MMFFVDSTLRNKLQWNVNRISNILIQENAFEWVVYKMAAILSRPQCVKCWFHVFIWDTNLAITAPADDLASNRAKASAGTMLTENVIYVFLQVSLALNYSLWCLWTGWCHPEWQKRCCNICRHFRDLTLNMRGGGGGVISVISV